MEQRLVEAHNAPTGQPRRGRLKIYLGFAPGVGKTCAMLNEAHELVAQGRSVLVGVVEDHGRPRTAALVEGLEVLPRHYEHGSMYGELDVEAVLAAHPDTVLVDELAHTVLGSAQAPDAKRWQDVHRLLDAGINVLSTLNIQHVESLNDVVFAITGVRQRETLPDRVLREADQIELVDLSPDTLRVRLARGLIYQGDTAQRALDHYFRLGNLTALRELALLWLADKVEEGMAQYRTERDIHASWPTRERVVVGVSGSPGSDVLIRRGARIAGRVADRELVVVHVARDDGFSRRPPDSLRSLQKLTEDLGGQWRVIAGDEVADTLLGFARTLNASQIVIGLGASTRRHRLGATQLSKQIINQAGHVDVHIVAAEGTGAGVASEAPAQARRNYLSTGRKAVGWGVAAVAPPLVTLALTAFHPSPDYVGAVLLGYLTIVVFAALAGGLRPAILAVLSGSLLVNWFLTTPEHTLTITEPESLISILFFFIVAVCVAWIVDVAAQRTHQAQQRQAQAIVLADLARGAIHEGDDLPSLLRRIQQTFSLHRVDLQRWAPESHQWVTLESTSPRGLVDKWDPEAGERVELGPRLRLSMAGPEIRPEQRTMIEARGARITAILDRQEIDAVRRAAAALETSNRVGSALLAAVSHDLRTPLASIKAAVSGLMLGDVPLPPEAHAALIESIEESADRLETVIGNLLDMSRLNSGTIAVHQRRLRAAEIIEAVLAEQPELREHIRVEVSEGLPALLGDSGLLQRALANLLRNALLHGEAPVLMRAVAVEDTVEIQVIDHGPGIPEDQRETLFTPFVHRNDTGTGLGLGLAVVRGFAEAMHGDIRVDDTPGGGATMILSLPAATGGSDE
ncbi:ATP-binding protein [Corynebacterium lowii]|uniref:histidine kinase n=1 Tax=Corynebacterium lowii TaxID=1544413 RepID=A0A0Q0U2Z1_9CORY|nr:ATP-binding protein [Corynebacterium lowii]KQB86238.1 Sensor protein KdpD [Corynebacterium lowii]MDP9852712.1 two-component system sensor histidine kinase KdpD [Corynebacterium lowii]